ncbi:unnamed protein product, partial [Ectocarpus sp. 6 AP-2014]
VETIFLWYLVARNPKENTNTTVNENDSNSNTTAIATATTSIRSTNRRGKRRWKSADVSHRSSSRGQGRLAAVSARRGAPRR